ncbi:ezrin-like [Macrobrachium nipponense]|uniref:ezrin-like n=1 Tax=Macrobrachium nipponense TaxID=159736 RepID=UPI0030C8692B
MVMSREYEVMVKTPLRDVSTTIDSHTTGQELFDNVMASLSIVETEYFILQYKNKKGNYRDLLLKKKVLSIKKKTRESPVRFFLNVSVFPADPVSVQDFTAKRDRGPHEDGDLLCPKDVAKNSR